MPFINGFSVQESWIPPLQGGVGSGGAAYLALKRQAIQISPFQGEGGDKPLPYNVIGNESV